MNTAKTLFSILNVLIFLIFLALGIGLLIGMFSLLGYIDGNSTITIDGKNIVKSDLTTAHYIFMMLNLIVYLVFIFGVIKLRQVAKLLLYNDIYDLSLISNTELVGKSFVITGIFWWLFDGLSSVHFNNELSIGVSDKTFIYLFITCIGLFIMLVSNIIGNGIQLKAENDLTI